jgi:DHA1 family bicyclomycin/chloramphenicol resistance-like MFS transporter
VLCAVAPSIETLILVRFVQGLAGAAGIVIARAIVRDLYSGKAAARFFATLILVNGMAPILAPVLGGQLLHVTDWRGVFLALSVIGVALLAAALWGIEETNTTRVTGGLRATGAAFAALFHDRAFVWTVVAGGCAFGALFSYIAGSPFVLQEVYGLSEQEFSWAFGANAVGIVIAGRASRSLVDRVGPARLFTYGVLQSMAGGWLLLVAIEAGLGLFAVLASLFVLVSAIGFVVPNGTALAMERHPERAGSASAMLGLAQYAFGACAAPLVSGSERTMGIVIATLGTAAVVARLGSRAV